MPPQPLGSEGQEDYVVGKFKQEDQDLVQKTTVTILYVLPEKGFQHTKMDPKESQQERATLFDPYGSPNEVSEVVGGTKRSKH